MRTLLTSSDESDVSARHISCNDVGNSPPNRLYPVVPYPLGFLAFRRGPLDLTGSLGTQGGRRRPGVDHVIRDAVDPA